jgi:pyruvate-ferredoxin/flavodoxin oxidoreductase
MIFGRRPTEPVPAPPFPGEPATLDGSEAIVAMETAASEAAGAYPITPSTQMGEGWAVAVAQGKLNVNGRRLLFFEPEGEHAAAAVTAGMSMIGLRATNFSSGQGIAYMHESLYAAVGKRLTYVLNMACRAMTKQALNVHAGHDDYHAVDDTGFFQVFAKNVQEAADLNLIAHRIAELSLNPGICAQDGFLTSHVIESMRLPEPELVRRFLGDPADMIASPTPAQRMVFGEQRRRIPEMFDLDYPAMLGVVQNQESYAQGVAAQRPFYFDHIREITDAVFDDYAALTGRRYARASGYRTEDAEYLVAGQGSIVWNLEAVVDHLREKDGLRVGVVNVTMFRPFPADQIVELFRGKKAVTVLERLDQPLAADPPLLREIRAVMGKAVENGRARGAVPHEGIPAIDHSDVPDFSSCGFGMGSRDVQASDLLAAIHNMLPTGRQRRQFYLGIDFLRPETRLPKLELWQEKLEESYPKLGDLSIHSKTDLNLLPKDSLALRIHSVGGWGAITMGKNLALTASELLGLHVKANPKYGSEKKGQPTTFFATLASEPVRLNAELRHVDVVLSPDPNVFRHSNPIAGLAAGGVFIIQSETDAKTLWASFPATAQKEIRERKIRLFALDGFAIAADEASEAEHRYRMQGAAFMGAFFRAAPLMAKHDLDEARLFQGIAKQLNKKFGRFGQTVVDDNLRVIRRGFAEVTEVAYLEFTDKRAERGTLPVMPLSFESGAIEGLGHGGRFWEQVGFLYQTGEDVIADPFAAISAIPAATSTLRDMTDVRFEVPEFIAEQCTGCGQCWVQCPDAAIPGLVNTVEEVLEAAVASRSNGRTFDRFRPVLRPLARETQRLLAGPIRSVSEALTQAYQSVVERMAMDPERRAATDSDFAVIHAAVAEFPLAKTAPFFDVPEGKQKGTGGLLSITVHPEACKGCNICVDVCPDQALITIRQDDAVVDRLRRNWDLWQRLPDTNDRYVNVRNLEEGIGVLTSLLLKKDNYRSMFGGDGACMGCGEKTAIHLVYSAVNALMYPRVARQVVKLDDLIGRLDQKARALVAADADLDRLDAVEVAPDKRAQVERIAGVLKDLKDLRWRYTEGPSGRGRATLGIANATGCSSVWGSTYPYNPYPFPWVNHLFQDAPSIAIGIFEGQMRKMADGFKAVRRAELELDGEYDAEKHEQFFIQFDWHQFTEEEFNLCPPIFAVGGDGAMLDIGFQNLSRLLASGKPIRVVVLDTQVYSNTGGQACTSGFTGQVSDMAAWGKAQHGKEETRKELALLVIAHRNAFVLQGSQANPSHLLAGVLKGLKSRRPAVFSLHCPCPPEHGLADDQANRAAKYALESRAFPVLVYDPDGGNSLAECISLDGNPAIDDTWPTYDLRHRDGTGEEQVLTLPMTIADWAATESRFKKHFTAIPSDGPADDLLPFAEYMERTPEERGEFTPYIQTLDGQKQLARFAVSHEIVELAEDRLKLWHQLRQMAGLEVPQSVRDMVSADLEIEFDAKFQGLQADFERRMSDLKARYPQVIARRLAEGLIRAGGDRTVADILAEVPSAPGLGAMQFDIPDSNGGGSQGNRGGGVAVAEAAAPPTVTTPSAAGAPANVAAPDTDDGALEIEPYIDTARCTSCDECININRKLFGYNDKKQAVIKDPRAGTFKDLVTAAERCPVAIIHPGTPLNPKEKGLDKLLTRAAAFN